MAENTSQTPFSDLIGEPVDAETMQFIRSVHSPVLADEFCTLYRIGDKLIVDEPLLHLEAAPIQSCCDRAVMEAGFATEPLRHCVTELLDMLTTRMMEDGVRGFTHGEWIAVRNARELLSAEESSQEG